jgi:hypothetical protein
MVRMRGRRKGNVGLEGSVSISNYKVRNMNAYVIRKGNMFYTV